MLKQKKTKVTMNTFTLLTGELITYIMWLVHDHTNMRMVCRLFYAACKRFPVNRQQHEDTLLSMCYKHVTSRSHENIKLWDSPCGKLKFMYVDSLYSHARWWLFLNGDILPFDYNQKSNGFFNHHTIWKSPPSNNGMDLKFGAIHKYNDEYFKFVISLGFRSLPLQYDKSNTFLTMIRYKGCDRILSRPDIRESEMQFRNIDVVISDLEDAFVIEKYHDIYDTDISDEYLCANDIEYRTVMKNKMYTMVAPGTIKKITHARTYHTYDDDDDDDNEYDT